MGALAALRDRVAAVLAPVNGDGWDVHVLPVDAVHPPAFLLTWSDQWLTPATHCQWSARLDVVAISNRIDVEPGVEILEELVEAALARLDAAGMPAVRATRPGRYPVGGVTYLATRLTLTHPVNF